MAKRSRSDIAEILDAANAGRPLRNVEVARLLCAAGVPITQQGVRMAAAKAEDKIRRGLVAAVGAGAIVEACTDD